MKARYLMICLLVFGWIEPLQTQEELPVGARPMAIAAFTARADDAHAVMWNPAGITQLSQQEVGFMRADLFDTEVTQNNIVYVLPVTNQLAIGANLTMIRFEDEEIDYRKDRVHLAGAYRPFDWLSCGINVKSLFSSTKLDGVSEGDTRRFDGDIGVLVRPLPDVQLAVVLRDVATPWITHEYQNRISHEEISGRQGIVGLAYQTPLPNLILSAETDVELNDRLRVGGEYQFGNLPAGIQAALRGGLHQFWDTRERPSFALGGSIGVPVSGYAKVFFEYAYLDSPVLSGTHRFEVRVPFDFNPTLVEIDEKVEFPEGEIYVVFSAEGSPAFIPSLLPYDRETYLATVPVTVYLRSKHDEKLTVSIKLTIPSYVEGTVAENIVLFPQEKGKSSPDPVKIQVSLPTKILNLENNISLNATIEVDYKEIRRYKSAKGTFPMVFRKPGLVPFAKGVPPFAAFIDPQDPIVRQFAGQITAEYAQAGLEKILPQQLEASERNLFFNKATQWRPLLNTMQIYEVLRHFGLRYVPDALPYNRRGEVQFDEVKYPRDFLTSPEKADDCDTISVVIAALLESADIRTALVEVPGHVFVLVNTGLYYADGVDAEKGYSDQSGVLALPKDQFVRVPDIGDPNWDHHLAIPLDASQQKDDTFIEAWENGLKTYDQNKGTAKIFIVRLEHEKYPPAHPPREPKQPPQIEDFRPIDKRVLADVGKIVQWQREHKGAEQADDLLSLIKAGTELAQRGDLPKAKATLLKADAMDEDDRFPAIKTNLANVALLEGKPQEALGLYQRAHELAPDDGGILWNLAVTYLVLGRKDSAAEWFLRWKEELGGNILDAFRHLSIPPEPPKEIQGPTAILESKLHTLLERVRDADTRGDLNLTDLQFSSEELKGAASGIYWKSTVSDEKATK